MPSPAIGNTQVPESVEQQSKRLGLKEEAGHDHGQEDPHAERGDEVTPLDSPLAEASACVEWVQRENIVTTADTRKLRPLEN